MDKQQIITKIPVQILTKFHPWLGNVLFAHKKPNLLVIHKQQLKKVSM